MKSKILLVNFNFFDQDQIKSLGVEVDLGFLGDANSPSDWSDQKARQAKFFSPLSIYEYKAIFIKLLKSPYFSVQGEPISEEQRSTFFNYWRKKGVLVLFLEDSNFTSLECLGINDVTIKNSTKKDVNLKFTANSTDRPFIRALEQLRSSVIMPSAKVIGLTEPQYGVRTSWSRISIYENLNDVRVGICICNNNRYSVDYNDPQVAILPAYKNYPEAISLILKSYAKLHPQHLPELYEADWTSSEKYYPQEIGEFNNSIKGIEENAFQEIQKLKEAKESAKQKCSSLRAILYESGDRLKSAVISVLSEVFKFNVEDADANKKNNLGEDILIRDDDGKVVIFGEVKGTRDDNPSQKYIVQLLTHMKKGGEIQANGALILNHDLTTDPDERNDAYSSSEDEELIKDIFFVDTRVIFNLALAIIDHEMPAEEAKSILFKKGRATFDLQVYLRTKKQIPANHAVM